MWLRRVVLPAPRKPVSTLTGTRSSAGGVVMFFFQWCRDHQDLHNSPHSFPTRRSSDLTWRSRSSSLGVVEALGPEHLLQLEVFGAERDRKSTRLNSSHGLLTRMPSS